MFENYSDLDLLEVIDVNKLIVSYENEPHKVELDVLKNIFSQVNSFNDISDRRTRIIKKASFILAGISYEQPFAEGNRRTSYYILKSFLGRNGFTLRPYSDYDKETLADLLHRTTENKFEYDPTIYTEVEQYLSIKVENVKFDYL